MKQEYQNWIDNYLSTHKFCAGLCFSASALMLKSFPELILTRGYVYDIHGKKHNHWWLQTIDGEVIDPTASQFIIIGDASFLKYEEYNESRHGPLPTGKCMNCGKHVYNDSIFCNNECSAETKKYLMTHRSI